LNNVLGKMSPFKTDHNLILWKLEKKRELSQKSPRLATESGVRPVSCAGRKNHIIDLD
jgi:hypothetical protein